MEREELNRLLRQKPFQPFRVVVNDGRTYDVRYPEMNLLAQRYIKIGIPDNTAPRPMCDHTEYVALSEIARVEPWPMTASST